MSSEREKLIRRLEDDLYRLDKSNREGIEAIDSLKHDIQLKESFIESRKKDMVEIVELIMELKLDVSVK